MKRWRQFAMTLIMAMAIGLGLRAQVQTQVPPVDPGRKTSHGRTHQDPWRVPRGQPGGRRRRPRCNRLSAAQLPERQTPPLSRGLRSAWLLHRRRAVDSRNPRAANHRRCFRRGRKGDDRGSAGLEDAAQRVNVLEFRDNRRFREVHLPRCGGLHRRDITGRFPTA